MSINTTLAGLSTNPALNGPDGAVDPPSALDDQQRYHGAFIAQLRDGTGFSVGAAVAALGFTPVQQGTGTSQLTNTVKIGWSATSQLRAQVDATDFGVNWPINITGNAATATNATNAATAANASALGGVAPTVYVKSNTGNVLGLTWDGTNGWVYPTVDGTVQSSYTLWGKIPDRPTNLSQFTNGPGYQTAAQLIAYAVQRRQGVISLENIAGGTSGMAVEIGGGVFLNWGVTVSDGRLKENIKPTTQDSLAKVRRLSFKSFNFEPGHDDGHEHKSGLIAQDLEAIDPELVDNRGTWKQPMVWEMLCMALHAVQQLEARVAELEGRA
jgi:hypothetical protein